tara:strand:+ start:150 stop:377 length:228 start_codon:yes stop_codon:yes gene_type:complete
MTLKKKNSKKSTIIATSSTDLGLVLNWLRLKKSISSSGPMRDAGNGFAVSVKSKLSKKDLNNIVKEKFGVFAKVI